MKPIGSDRMSERTTLMCWPVRDTEPAVQSVIDTCADCHAAIWRALSSPPADRVLCMACARRAMAAERDAVVAAPTAAQLRDIERALKD